jgi:hypothetical protein
LSDDNFKQFILSNETIAQADSLASTLARWKKVNIAAIGKRAFNYLPEDAAINAKVYIVLKPRKNSFVWVKGGHSLLFLYLNPRLSRRQFENKAIHELHHVGINSLERKLDSIISHLPLNQQNAIKWLGGFGEGEAMLAAAGSPHVHPHHYDDSTAIHEWDRNMNNFNRDQDSLLVFYQKILDGRVTSDADIEAAAGKFYGAQGPFYTVGYKMASLVELTFGRDVLVRSYTDPRKLLILYNEAVIKRKLQMPFHLWPESFLHALEAGNS